MIRKDSMFFNATLHTGQFPHRETNLTMNVRMSLLGALLLAALVLPASSETVQQADAAPQPQTPVPTGTQTATLPAQSPATQGSAPLRVMVGKSLLINTTERLKRISITDPAIAFAQVITPTQILVHGKSPGEVSLLICR